MKMQNAKIVAVLVCFLGLAASCSDSITELQQDSKEKTTSLQKSYESQEQSLSETDQEYLANLKAYKASKHQIMAGYYRTWLDKAVSPSGATVMTALPDSLDIAIVFRSYTPDNSPFWKALKEKYIPYLHARGTKVMYTGSATIEKSDLPKDKSFSSLTQEEQERLCQLRANQILARIREYNFDGFDIDIEEPFSQSDTGKARDKRLQIQGVMKALSAHLGPLSETQKLLTLDTNQNAYNELNKNIIPYISYVFFQAYWRNTWYLDQIFSTYKAHKLKPEQFVPGFSFYEEDSPFNWGDVHYPDDGKGRCYDYARWQPRSGGKKGGIFAYAIDRDIPYLTNKRDAPNYAVTKRLIHLMNPEKYPTGNLIKNPGFEQADEYWNGDSNTQLAVYKYKVSQAPLYQRSAVLVLYDKIHSGILSVSLGANYYSKNARIYQRVFGLKPNTTYKLSAWILNQNEPYAEFPVSSKLGVRDYGGDEKSVQVNTRSRYVSEKVLFTTGARASSVIIYVDKIAGEGKVYVDDFSLTEVQK